VRYIAKQTQRLPCAAAAFRIIITKYSVPANRICNKNNEVGRAHMKGISGDEPAHAAKMYPDKFQHAGKHGNVKLQPTPMPSMLIMYVPVRALLENMSR